VLIGTLIIVLTVPAIFILQHRIVSGLAAMIAAFASRNDPPVLNEAPLVEPVAELQAAAE